MAGTSLIALIDDIASILDDIALLTKVATKKTVGVLGDDLALNAQQVSGVAADRELPVVWAVAKGSARNKAILVPVALALSAFAPWAVTPLLMFGGAFLCFEGFEKIAHRFLHPPEEDGADRAVLEAAIHDPGVDLVELEKVKVKGAVRTDFVLSAEIVAIALGTVASAPLLEQLLVLVGLSALMTVGVYGLVGAIVKLDDLGRFLHLRGKPLSRATGSFILRAAPYLMKALSIAGTVAMFLVGGGILLHGVPSLHHLVDDLVARVHELSGAAATLAAVLPALIDGLVGLLAGAVAVAVITLFQRLRGNRESTEG
jgi:predicted DNA repair protein MutK